MTASFQHSISCCFHSDFKNSRTVSFSTSTHKSISIEQTHLFIGHHHNITMSAPVTIQGQGEHASAQELRAQNKVRPPLHHLTSLNNAQHHPGVHVGNDAAPEFHAKTLPPGTAPKEHTFQPNVTAQTDVPGASHPQTGKETYVSAQDTIGGATSADVHTGLGKPIQGQTSGEDELDKKGQQTGDNLGNLHHRDPFKEKGVDVDHEKGGKVVGEKEDRATMKDALDREPETAESVAAERD
jgi:hypothetical protein